MKAEYYPPNEDVILQNEAPTDFYILVTGAVVKPTLLWLDSIVSYVIFLVLELRINMCTNLLYMAFNNGVDFVFRIYLL